VDVAFDGNNATYQIVFSEVQSALDFDVIAVSYNASIDLLFPAVSIDTTSESWGMPKNASCYLDEQFLCVSVVGNSIGSERVWGRTRHAGTGVRGSQFPISGFGARNVDVGGKGNSVSSIYDFMVVWQESDTINQDMDIVAQAVNSNSSLTQGRILIDGDVGDLDRNPSISKSSGRPDTTNGENEYMIVWEREISSSDRNLRAQVIEYTGSMTGHNQFNAYTFSDSLNPDVSTMNRISSYNDEPYWVVVFERLVGSDYDIFAVVARDGNADNARSVTAMQALDLNLDHRDPAIACDGVDFFICYQTEALNGDRAVHFTSANVLHDDGELRTGLSLRREQLALSEGAPASIGIASHWDGGGPFVGFEPGNALATWTFRDGASNDTDVAGAIVVETLGSASGSQYCAVPDNSSGTSGWIRARTNSWNPGTTVSLYASDLPVNVFAHFIVSNQPGLVLFPGGSQ
ncbi:MAG: hypothetical protein P1V35_05815, partial [Planctomycetota bacterium]|nr:hypothetical protein [Planctomycetota bacterium]